MHYYALIRHSRMPGMWVKLDSQLPAPNVEHRNLLLRETELWELYSASKPLWATSPHQKSHCSSRGWCDGIQ
eukprot:Skav226127  [mRNA]  locus=scaffold1047:294105:294320:- [translate_table: standard]